MNPIIKLPEGTPIGNWVIGSELGRGGQGVVWSARPTTTKRTPPRALKASFSDDPTDRARFEREIELLKRCANAPNILQIVDSDPSWAERVAGFPALAYHVSERCEGSLEERKRKLGDAGARIALFREACDAVRYLHELDEPLIHRDIKPANFLVALEPRRLVLADFGIARPLDTDETLTQIQEVVGTQHFRAPEITAGQKPTLRSDIFSLGRVLEWLLTGDVSTDLSTRPVPRGGNLADEVCVLLDAIIVRATQPVAVNRYASVQELIAQIPDLWLSLRPRADGPVVSAVQPLSARQAIKTAKELAKAEDRAAWRETELELKKSYIEGIRRWRGENEQPALANSQEGYIAFAETLYRPLMARLAFALGGVLSQKAPFNDQRRTLEQVLSLPDWNWGGRVVALSAPLAIGFLYNYLHGALCCELDRFDLAIQFATTSFVHAEDSNKMTPLWQQPQLVGWPETLGRNSTYSSAFLQGAFERFDVMPDLFANQPDYQTALASYSILLSFIEMSFEAARIAALTKEQLRQRIMINVPLMFVGMSREWIATAARRTVGNREVVQQVSDISKTKREVLASAWPNWKLVLNRVDPHSFYEELPLGNVA